MGARLPSADRGPRFYGHLLCYRCDTLASGGRDHVRESCCEANRHCGGHRCGDCDSSPVRRADIRRPRRRGLRLFLGQAAKLRQAPLHACQGWEAVIPRAPGDRLQGGGGRPLTWRPFGLRTGQWPLECPGQTPDPTISAERGAEKVPPSLPRLEQNNPSSGQDDSRQG